MSVLCGARALICASFLALESIVNAQNFFSPRLIVWPPTVPNINLYTATASFEYLPSVSVKGPKEKSELTFM